MKLYTGVKVVEAREDDGGYLVQFSNGETAWRTKQQFEDNYRQCEGTPFSVALEAMKRGKRVRRPTWEESTRLYLKDDEWGQFLSKDLEDDDILAEDWEILV